MRTSNSSRMGGVGVKKIRNTGGAPVSVFSLRNLECKGSSDSSRENSCSSARGHVIQTRGDALRYLSQKSNAMVIYLVELISLKFSF